MKTWTIALRYLFVMTLLTGVVYPLGLTGISEALLKSKAEGALMRRDGKILGSHWIGQKFESPKYFWPRPSAVDYNPQPSGGSNLGPTSRALIEQVAERRAKLGDGAPQDLLFASASGLDPHLSPESALFQVDRVATARALNGEQRTRLRELVESAVEDRQFGILGEPRVNVLELNLTLDAAFSEPANERSSAPQT